MKYLEDTRLTQLTSDLTGAFLNTRGSGNGGGGGSTFNNGNTTSTSRNTTSRRSNNNGKKGKNNNKKQQQQQKSNKGSSNNTSSPAGSPTSRNKNKKKKQATTTTSSSSSPAAYYTYNPVGYSTYNNNGAGGTLTPSSHSSCRVIYGRVEAYTTKRAGSDKKTAFEVGERYAHEMERLNEAVEALKRKHSLEHEKEDTMEEGGNTKAKSNNGVGEESDDGQNEGVVEEVVSKRVQRRGRSRSLDGVTFATAASPRLVYDKSANTAAMMCVTSSNDNAPTLSPLEEDVVSEDTSHNAKRDLPLEGILKSPSSSSSSSSNKRCRATSFDISTGPSTPFGPASRRYYHHGESSSSLLAGAGSTSWDNNGSGGIRDDISFVHPNNGVTPSSALEEDRRNTHPLIPQPSLYQSSLSDHEHHVGNHHHHAGGKNGDKTPTMVPRRLVTDLILTLNASFPDYDFGDAQVSDFCTLSMSEAMRRINDKLGEFAATTDEGARGFLPNFWSSLDDVLWGLKDCEVYSYAPKGSTGEDDPMEFLTMSMTAGANENSVGTSGGVANGQGGSVVFSPSGGGRIVTDGIMDTSMALDLPNQISPASCSDPPHVTLWSMNYFFVSRNKKRIVLFACVQTMRTPQGNDEDDYFDETEEYEYGENNLVFDEARRGIQMQDEKEDEYYGTNAYPSTSVPSKIVDSSNSNNKADLLSTPSGGDGESVMVEVDTDVDDQGGVDVDTDVDQGEKDFDMETIGISVGVPSHVA